MASPSALPNSYARRSGTSGGTAQFCTIGTSGIFMSLSSS